MKKSLMFLGLMLMAVMAYAQTPSLTVSPQEAMGTTVTIDSVTLDQDGWVVIHALDLNGELVLTPPLGMVYLTAGTHDNVAIDLDPTLLQEYDYGMGAKDVVPMVHVDDGDQVYEFPDGPDVPVMVGDQMVVANLSVLSVDFGGMMAMGSDTGGAMMGDTGGAMMGSETGGAMMGESGGAMMDNSMMVTDGTYEIELSGSQEVPPVMTDATGSATFTLTGNSLSLTGDFSGLSSPAVAIAGSPGHIHMAAMGENGDVIIPLNVTLAEDGMSGIFSVDATLTPEQTDAIMAGNLYVNFHTEMNQGGELRGQIVPGMMGMGMMGEPSLTVSAQTAMDNTVTLDSVTLDQDGWVVIHALDTNGELVLTPPLGMVYLTAGTHDNVAIMLDPMLLSENDYGMGAKNVVPMIHVDDGDQVYEFPDGPDVPVMVADSMVTANMEVTLP